MITSFVTQLICDAYDQVRHSGSVMIGHRHSHYKNDFLDNPSLGMLFSVLVAADNGGYVSNDGNRHYPKYQRNVRKYVHIIITSQHRVYVAESDLPGYKDVPIKAWKNTSNHDSCWRSDGLRAIQSTYFKVAHLVWGIASGLPKKWQRPPARADVRFEMNGMVTYTGGPLCFVSVVRRVLDEDEGGADGYHDGLAAIKKVDYKISIQMPQAEVEK